MTSPFIGTLLALSGQQGVYQSDGTTWTKQIPTGSFNLFNCIHNPRGHLLIYGDGNPGYFLSTDGGATWTGGGVCLNAGGFGWPIGFDESDAIYDITNGTGVQKSTDIGVTFTLYQPFVQASDPGFTTNSQSVWVARSMAYWNERARQSGVTVAALSRYDTGISSYLGLGADQILVRGLYSEDYWTLAYTNLGFHLWTWVGASPTLTDLTSTLPALGTEGIYSVIPFDTQTWFLAEAQASFTYCKVWKTTDGGATWAVVSTDSRAVPSPGVGNGGACFIDRNPANTSEMVMAALGGVFTSTDGGDTWTFLASPNSSEAFAAVQFAESGNCLPLVGTDFHEGAIVKRDAAGSWTVPFTSSGATLDGIETMLAVGNDVWGYSRVSPFVSPPGHTVIWTTDGGATWNTGTGGFAPPPAGSSSPSSFPDDYGPPLARDENGVCYGFKVDNAVGTGELQWYKSTDHGQSWTAIPYLSTGDSVTTGYHGYASGKLWWVEPGTMLRGIAPVGTGAISDSGPSGTAATLMTMTPFVNRVYFYRSGAGFSVDLSYPTSPVTTAITGPQPFMNIIPVTNLIAIAQSGSNLLYRTVDAGATWTLVLTDSDLSGGGAGQPLPAAVDGSTIWLIGTFPYLFTSDDLGETWTKITYTGPSLGSTVKWECIAIACAGSGGSSTPPPFNVFAAAARRRAAIQWLAP